MKPIVQTAFAIMALFALTACGGGGGGGSTPVAENNPPAQAQPAPPTNTDPMSPQPLPPPPAPEPINWEYDDPLDELSISWDGNSMTIDYLRGSENMPTNAVFPSFVPDTLTFTDGLAWGAIDGDRQPTFGSVDMVLRVPTRRMTYDFDFPGTRLDSPRFARQLTGWQWQDSDGVGSLIRTNPTNNAPVGVYGIEAYDNSLGVEVEAAYWNVVDDYIP